MKGPPPSLKNLWQDRTDVSKYWKRSREARSSPEQFIRHKRSQLYNFIWRTTLDVFLIMGKITASDKVLDVGCGWGRMIVGILRERPQTKITGIDITHELLLRARKVIEEEIGDAHVQFICTSGDNLPFEDCSFDVVVSTRVFQYIPEPDKAASELFRVLRPGGRSVVQTPNKWNPLLSMTYHTKLCSPNEIAEWFRHAGFQEIRSRSVRFVPAIRYFSETSRVLTIERLLQMTPLLKWFGGLASVSAIKPAL